MKRKLMISISVCMLAITLVSANFVGKPYKVLNVNVPDLYESIGVIPDGPVTVPDNAGDDDVIWSIVNNTDCAYDYDVYFGIDNNPSLDPISLSITGTVYAIGSTLGNTNDITLTQIKSQYAYTTLGLPFNITHGAIRIRPNGTSIPFGSGNTSYAGQSPFRLEFVGQPTPCDCVIIVWDASTHTVYLNPCP